MLVVSRETCPRKRPIKGKGIFARRRWVARLWRKKFKLQDLLRRSKATHLSDNGIGLPIISRYLGHAEITTTMVYVKPNQQKIQEALESVRQQVLPKEDPEEYDKMRARLCGLRQNYYAKATGTA
ncbi:MAG: hypothetical protein EOM68_28690 [Spirochaetia bacterium]|nr:hypothetical protein [Spirochaetia bacterium]